MGAYLSERLLYKAAVASGHTSLVGTLPTLVWTLHTLLKQVPVFRLLLHKQRPKHCNLWFSRQVCIYFLNIASRLHFLSRWSFFNCLYNTDILHNLQSGDGCKQEKLEQIWFFFDEPKTQESGMWRTTFRNWKEVASNLESDTRSGFETKEDVGSLKLEKRTEETKETEDSQQNLRQDNTVSKLKCKVQNVITLAITKSTVFPITKKGVLGIFTFTSGCNKFSK